MADSTTNITQISSSQGSKEVTANALFDASSPGMLYGRNALTTTGLTWGYYGGRLSSTSVANGTVALTLSTTNYVVALRSDGTVSASTATTNWDNQTDYIRLYKIVAGASTISSYEDHRQAVGALPGALVNPMTTEGDVITAGASGSPQRLAVGTEGYVLTVVSGVPAWAATGVATLTQCIPIACSDETTALTTGTAKVTFRMPFAFTLSAVRASLTTAQSSGSIFTVDINESGTTILSTKLTIDNSEKTSTTAATAAVISDSALADDAEITIDIDQVGDGTAAGLKVYLIGVKA